MQNYLKTTEGMDINGGLAVRAFSATASAINITGHVNRIAA